MTVHDLIRRSMRALGVLRSGENPSAAEAADALDTLNDMLNAWRQEGIDLEHLTLALTDVLPYPDDHVACIRYNLSVELAAEYGVGLSPSVAMQARRTFLALRSQYMQPVELSVDDALRPIFNPNHERGYYKEI
jgi:hypothetical protein